MSWVCSYCSSTNADENTRCEVCGSDRSILSSTEGSTGGEVRVCLWGYEAIKRAVNRLVETASAWLDKVSAAKKERRLRGSGKKAKATRKKTERVKSKKSEKVSRVRCDFADPWPEHCLKLDPDAIKSRGFVRSERAELNSVKGYTFYREDGTHQFIRAEMLIALRIATAA